MIEPSRRGLLLGFAGLLAAPAIVRASSLMPVKAFEIGDGVALLSTPHPVSVYVRRTRPVQTAYLGFAQLKQEGATVSFNPAPLILTYPVAPGAKIYKDDAVVIGRDGYARAMSADTLNGNHVGYAVQPTRSMFDD